MLMHSHEFELAIGDTIHVGDHTLTVVDMDGAEVIFRVDDPESIEPIGEAFEQSDSVSK